MRSHVPDTIEYMHFDARIARLRELANGIVRVLRDQGAALPLTEFFDAVAKTLRLPLSQVKYGLTFAKSSGQVTVDERGMVALTAYTPS